MQAEYKKLQIYQSAYPLTLKIYRMADTLPERTKGNLSSQIRRAASSIPLNIAEGSTKRSPKEFLCYLHHAFGSAKELEVILNLCMDLKYISVDVFEIVFEMLDTLMAQLFKYMQSLESGFSERRRFYTKYHHSKPVSKIE